MGPAETDLVKSINGGTQMSNDQDLSQEDKKAPTLDSNPGPNPNELASDEIIELMDVVGEDKDPLRSVADAPLLLDEEELDHDPIKLPEDITVEGLVPPSFAAEKTDPAVVASDTADSAEMKEAFPGDDFSPLESSDFKFEDSSAFEAADAEPFPAQSQENLDDVLAGLEKEASAFEKPEDILADLEKDEPEAVEPQIEQAEEFPSGYEQPDEDEKPIDVPAGPAVLASDTFAESAEKPEETDATHDIPGISEERMKELLTEVIQETVDKAVRETVSQVTEKVIREAIDTLKQSIASSEP
jgi:hypothetical protein